MTGAATRFPFRFDPVFRPVLALLGVRPATAWVAVTERDLMIRYGPWRLRTDRGNVTGVELSGPYRWWRAIGPHLSLADGGVDLRQQRGRRDLPPLRRAGAGAGARRAAPAPGGHGDRRRPDPRWPGCSPSRTCR